MTKDEALKMALDWFESGTFVYPTTFIIAIKEALAQPEQEPVTKPYAYEYGQDNGDGTYTVVIKKGDLGQIKPAVYDYVRPKNAHKDWPIKELFDRPQPKQKPVAYLCENAVGHKYFRWKKPSSTYKPIALYTTPPAQPEQEPVGKFAKFTDGIWREVTDGSAGISLYTTPPVQPEHIAFLSGAYEIMSKHCDELMEQLRQEMKNKTDQAKERNFCPRCGKRTPDLTAVHTCTPPKE